jgi:5-(aminomethyl)-3-furanmethanol phosphate kinase
MIDALIPPVPCILKLGGSLHDAPELGAWLKAVATVRGPPRILVPGGGPFADAVRAAQTDMGFHDLAAHRMAILAMQQYGLALQAKEPRLVLAETEAQLRAVSRGQGAVWLPWLLAGRDDAIEASWEITSDSLALWLACRLRAPLLLLVKSVRLEVEEIAAKELAAQGVIDTAFPRLLPGFGGTVRVLHRSDSGRLAAALGGIPAGCLLSA